MNDSDAHVAMRRLSRSRMVEDFLEIEFQDGSRAWVHPGTGVSFPDAGKAPALLVAEKRIRDLEREVSELHARLGIERWHVGQRPTYRNMESGL